MAGNMSQVAQHLTQESSAVRMRPIRMSVRDALVAAAQELIALEGDEVPVQRICDRAGVAAGSLYTHFANRDELVEVAAETAMATFEDDLLARTVDIVDPIDVFCMRMRLYGLMPDTHPLVARLVFRPTSPALAWPHGYPAAARDDVEAILATGRARCDDIDLLLLAAFAAFERLIAVRLLDPGIGPARVDELAAFVLIWLGIPKRQAHARASRALPLAAGQGRPGDLGRS